MGFKIPEKYHAVDMHNHVWFDENKHLDVSGTKRLLDAADRLGIEKIGISLPLLTERVTPEEFRYANDTVLEAMSMSSRFIGFAFVDPYFADEARQEIIRCINAGMAGVKLYHQFTMDDDAQKPVCDTAAELGVPVLMHAGLGRDPETCSQQPRLSNAQHFLNALEKFPDTVFIQGHIGGGGDWEWNLQVLRNISSDRYFIDLSGSVCDAEIVRRTVEAVGINRVLWATDMSMEESVAKLDAAQLSEEELHLVLHGNFERIQAMRKVTK